MAFVESTARGRVFTSTATRVRSSRWLIAMVVLICAVAWPVQTAEQITFTVVADFGASLPYSVVGPLVRDADGTIYGTGQVGGAFNRGGVFKIDPSGVIASLYDFSGDDGEFPASGLVRGTDGALYGTTNSGGANTTGTIFRITTVGALTTIHTFSARDEATGAMAEGGEPETPLAPATDGSLYGIAHTRGDADSGVLFQITPAGAFTIVHAFGGESVPLWQPRGGVVIGSDNAFYGAVAAGGEFGAGGLYRVTTADGALLHSFAADGSEGSDVRAPLTDGGDNTFYGTASSGGASGLGTVFSVTPSGTFTVLHSFAPFDPGTSTYPEGFAPNDGVALASDGNLYGVTSSGGAHMLGTIFRYERASQTFSVRKHLQEEGGSVVAPVVAGDDGKLYGASTNSGPSPYGAIFSFDPATSGSQIVLGFRANNPGQLYSGLTRGDDGLLYGVGYDGGGAAQGSIFRMSEQGSVTLLHLFTGSDGINPFARLVKGPDGSLYGTTVFGGNNRGTVFKVAPNGTFVPVYAFADFTANGQADGMYPYGTLAIDADSTIYGVTSAGGENNGGTLFKIVNGSFSVVYAFGATAPATGLPTGYAPMGGLTWGTDGRLYGTTTAGGDDQQRGTVFSYDPVAGTVTELAPFGEGTGYYPRSELLQASDGNFYGTAVGDGAGYGTVFRFDPQTSQISSVHDFSNGSDGATSFAPLIQGADQSLYGAATLGGDTGAGTLFRLALDGTFTPIHSFDYSQPGGASPSGGLVETQAGTFYGTTPSGSGNLPVVYRLTIGQQNHAPVARDLPLGTTEDTAVSDTLPASDADHDTLTFTLLSNGSKGAATLTNAATGAFTYTPKPDANGTDSLTFRVNDGKADSNVATVTVTIAPVNDPPVASNGSASVTGGSSTTGVLSATDIDSPSLTYAIAVNGSKGTAVVTNPASGAFTYTANAEASGSDTFTFKASDGQAASNVATITVTIQPARVDGLVAINGALTLLEDGRGRGALHATDSKHRRLTYQIVSNAKKGWVYLEPSSGQFRYLPKRNANGEDRFTFRAHAGNQWSNVATVAVVITPVNDPPAAWGPCVRVLRRGQTFGKIHAVDPDGDPVTFSLSKAPKFGTVTLTDGGGFTYVADGSRNHDAFTIKVSDPAGAFTLVRVVVLRRW